MKYKPIAIAIGWIFGIGLLLFILMQMQSYASIINDAGVVRGGTQRAVKLELEDLPSQETTQRVDNLLATLHDNESNRVLKTQETDAFIQDIENVQHQWDLIKSEIAALDQGEGSKEHLLELSEEHWQLADEMVLSAQKRTDKDFFWTLAVCFLLASVVSAFVSLLERHHRLKVNRMLRTDPLTGGRNLFAFEDEGAKLVGNASSGSYFVAHSNVSGFRSLNELYGRDAGNQVIKAFQKAFDQACGSNEITAHANADHFVALLHAEPNATDRMTAFEQSVSRHMEKNAERLAVGKLACGYGAFVLTDRKIDLATAVSNANAVLKNGTRVHGVAWYDNAFRMQLEHENNLAKHCEQALANHEFLPYLQSQVSLADNNLVGAELLCRWDSPELGFLSPDRFIPFFERNGFIAKLDFYMLEQACLCYPAARGNAPGNLRISVNFSRATILQAGFEKHLVNAVESRGIPAGFLEIEVTEGLFAVEENAVIAVMERLREHGFRFAMDDFGTGYSSLSLLRRLPIDVLKIDRGFLSQSTQTQRSLRVLKTAIELAKDLGMETVCEGIETPEQAQLLSDLGCDLGQGYLFDKPLPVRRFAERHGITLGDTGFARP